MSSKSLKSQYMKWLIMLATADLIVSLLFLTPGFSPETNILELSNWKLVAAVVVPVIVLLIVNAIPHSIKSALVYWKPIGWLPGSESFSRYAINDPRINMRDLILHVGELPTEPKEQNAKWYSLYKMVENEPEIVEVHKNFLMYRDMAVLSLPFIILAPISLFLLKADEMALWLSVGLFLLQYFLTAVSARWSGVRFVTNVIAIHSSGKPITYI